MNAIETDFVRIWIEDGILYGTYLAENIDEKMVEFMIQSKMELVNEKWYPMLVDFTRVKNLSRGARERLGKKDSGQYTIATAIIMKSKMQVLIYNFFNAIYKAPTPVKLFNDEESAWLWLQQFKKDS